MYVVAKNRDSQSGEWGRLLEWQDDEIAHQWAMPLALLQGDLSDVRRELARLDLSISSNKTAREAPCQWFYYKQDGLSPASDGKASHRQESKE